MVVIVALKATESFATLSPRVVSPVAVNAEKVAVPVPVKCLIPVRSELASRTKAFEACAVPMLETSK